MSVYFIDFETYYDKEYSLSKMTTEAYIRDDRFKVHGVGVAKDLGKPVWVTGSKVASFLARLNLEEHSIVGHNLLFDGGILSFRYGIKPKRYIDTLGLSRALLGPHLTRHGLTYVAERLCGLRKMDGLANTLGVRNLPPILEERLADYCIGRARPNSDGQWEAGDIVLTQEVFKRLLPHFPRSELPVMDRVVREFTDPVLAVDGEMLQSYIEELAQRKRDTLESVGLSDRKLLMSNQQFAEALIKLGVNPPTKINAKGKETFAFAKTDEGLKALLDHENPDVQALVAARLELKSTIEETRAARFLDASTRGLFPIPINYCGAMVTQRDSGADKMNLKNLTRKSVLRDSIYAPEPYILCVADLSQIECRYTLALGALMDKSNGAELDALDVMRSGGDIYCWFGSEIYGHEINKKDHPDKRQVAKSAVLGLGFGMGVSRFVDYCKQQNIDMPLHMAERIVKLYRNKFRGVVSFWYYCNDLLSALNRGEERLFCSPDGATIFKTTLDPVLGAPSIQTSSGLMIKYPDLRCDENGEWSYRQGSSRSKLFGGKVTENIVQSDCRNIQTRAIARITPLYRVPMDVYDEAVVLIPESEIEEGREFVEKQMTAPVSYLPHLPLACETHTGYRYGACK